MGSLSSGKGADRRAVSTLERLKSSELSSDPTNEEIELFDYLAASARSLCKTDLRKLLLPTARRWGQVHLWSEVVLTRAGEKTSNLLPVNEVVAAISVFGFTAVATT